MHRFTSEGERIKFELTAEPGWLQTSGGHAFCWYHPPRAPLKKQAVLLCDALGSERMNLHLTYRHMAIQFAYAGYPVLRLDYPGTCDSEGGPRKAAQMDNWLSALMSGADFLKARCGVKELTVFGAHIGGTLAAILASRREDVTGFAAWGAFATGSEYLRFLKVQERLTGNNPDKIHAPDWQHGDIESMGFLFTESTVASLKEILLDSVSLAGVRHACLVGWDNKPVTESLKELCRRRGAAIELIEGNGDEGTLSLEKQQVPKELIGKLLRWLDSIDVTAKSTALSSNDRLLQSAAFEGVVERAVFFAPDRRLFGIITTPEPGLSTSASTSKELPAIVLVNSGRNQRAGINRNYTEWARRWARQGYTVMRMDIAGLGDSPALRDSELNTLYLRSTREDVVAAMDCLQDNCGMQQFIVGGLCAGGFQSLQAARSDTRVVGLWLLELLRFYNDDRSLTRYFSRAIEIVVKSILPLHLVPVFLDAPLTRWLVNFFKRGGMVLTVYREDEPFFCVFRREIAALLVRNYGRDQLKIVAVPPANHIFSPLWSQAHLRDTLDHWLASTPLRQHSFSRPSDPSSESSTLS